MSAFLSIFDMLKIGVGPSSSHTLGPWIAAKKWLRELDEENKLATITSITVSLYGSLALTGKGHYTDKAVIFGLLDLDPETVDSLIIEKVYNEVVNTKIIKIKGKHPIAFDPEESIIFLKNLSLPFHPNALKFEAIFSDGKSAESIYFSIGGGFVIKENAKVLSSSDNTQLPFPSINALQLSIHCAKAGKSISQIVLENEKSFRSEGEIMDRLKKIWDVMREAAYIGCHTEGVLPGGLNVRRRAFDLNKQLIRKQGYNNSVEWLEAMREGRDFRKVITRISCLALAVNEVNASMGRIVTAPTNGSAGVIPAVLIYYLCFSGQKTSEEDIARFLLTAGEIGKYFKLGATISAAAGGCQAEIGVSSAMAAAALTERLGGSPAQALMAAEIAGEHHLGLTCDPVGGLVQIPCIERNSMGAVKAVTASMIALSSDPSYAKVSLDNLICTMKEISENMNSKYKETSLGGLAVNIGVNIPEC